jgi:peptide/nickel transport system permease protein
MATLAQPQVTHAPELLWELPQQRPLLVRLARPWLRNPLGFLGLILALSFIFLGIFGPYLAPDDPRALAVFEKNEAPSMDHWFGTNGLGQDMFSRILHGARLSFQFGALVMIFGFVPGTALGIMSGYFGRWIDYLIQRSAEAWTAFPQLPILLTVVAAVGPGLKAVIIVVAIGALFGGSRLLRAIALVEKHKDYVMAARAIGGNEAHILWRHVIPNIMPFILVGASSVFAIAVLAEASLSFLGLGVQVGTPGWGIDLAQGAREGGADYPHLVLFPGIAISLVVLGFNLLGDTLRDILDPRLRGST